MLSEDALNMLMQPIIARQEQINNYVILLIARRVNEIGKMKPTDLHKLERLYKMGVDVRQMNKELARLTGLNEKAIRKLIKEVAEDAYIDTKPYYDYRERPFLPFEDNIQLQRVVQAIAIQTANEYRNLSQTRAFMIRDLANPTQLKPTSLAKTYQTVIDEAVQSVQGGVVDYNTAMRRTMRQLNESGIRSVTYYPEKGGVYTQRLDTAVRRTILDGVREINQGVQDVTGKQYGADGKEISVHRYPAPDHEPVQGHQFSNTEWENLQNNRRSKDVNDNEFSAFKRRIGTWNCRHFAWSIIIGYAKPNYTEEQLKNIITENHKGYTLPNGKHMTMYECTQYQRRLETRVRKAKDGQMMAQELGDMELARKYQSEIDMYTKRYKSFSKACGLETQMRRMTVSGYKRISTKG